MASETPAYNPLLHSIECPDCGTVMRTPKPNRPFYWCPICGWEVRDDG